MENENTYKAVQGDTWDFIAYKLYGDEAYMQDLMEANHKYGEKLIMDGGEILTVPDIEQEEDDV